MKPNVQKTMEQLMKNNMQAYYVPDGAAVCDTVRALLRTGETVAAGGSKTLEETGVLDMLRKGDYNFLDRATPGLTRAQVEGLYRRAFFADTYFCSANAILESGALYNVDGNSNRVAALLYGPKQVIVVAGVNKLVPTLEDAVRRVKTVAAPRNTERLVCETPCMRTGVCVAADAGVQGMGEGCGSDARICCNYVLSAKQRIKERIKVILVGQAYGF